MLRLRLGRRGRTEVAIERLPQWTDGELHQRSDLLLSPGESASDTIDLIHGEPVGSWRGCRSDLSKSAPRGSVWGIWSLVCWPWGCGSESRFPRDDFCQSCRYVRLAALSMTGAKVWKDRAAKPAMDMHVPKTYMLKTWPKLACHMTCLKIQATCPMSKKPVGLNKYMHLLTLNQTNMVCQPAY